MLTDCLLVDLHTYQALCLANKSALLRPLIPRKHVARLASAQSRVKSGDAYPLQSVGLAMHQLIRDMEMRSSCLSVFNSTLPEGGSSEG